MCWSFDFENYLNIVKLEACDQMYIQELIKCIITDNI